MPNEGDHIEGGGDEESEESAQDSSEQSVRKRVRTNTPSPHRGASAPQGKGKLFTWEQSFINSSDSDHDLAIFRSAPICISLVFGECLKP